MINRTSPNGIRIPPLNGLQAFEAVARHASFAKAAEELAVTPSAISHRIAQLEAQLGVTLLLRVGPLVSLTSHGGAFLPCVRAALDQLRDGVAKVAGQIRTVVRLSLAPAIAANWLIQRLAAFQRLYPDINLEIVATSRYLNLRAGEADVGIRFGNGRWDGLDAEELIPVRIFPICSPGYQKAHPWLRTPADLAQATLLRHATMPWRPWFRAAGLDFPEPASGPAFSEVSLLINAAEHGQGVALAFSALVEPQLASGRLVKLFDCELPAERAYYLVTVANQPRTPEVQALIDWLLSTRDTAA